MSSGVIWTASISAQPATKQTIRQRGAGKPGQRDRVGGGHPGNDDQGVRVP